MLKGSLVLGTLILLSTPLKSDGYGRCESMAVISMLFYESESG